MAARRAQRIARFVLVILAGVYVALCVIARVGYPRVLFPAPRLERAPAVDDPKARLLELPQADGSHTVALYYPPSVSQARTVVLFHGNGETMFDNASHAAELTRRGLGVMLVEYRGYGTTYGPPPSEVMLYEDGEAAIAWLTREHVPEDRIALWGWSLGSGIASEMARRGHGARLVLLAPFTSMIDMGKRVAPILPVSLLLAHRLDTLSKAGEIKQKTIVVHGDEDELIPLAMGETVAKAIAGARFIRIKGGHHADFLYPGSMGQPAPQELFDLLAAHLASE